MRRIPASAWRSCLFAATVFMALGVAQAAYAATFDSPVPSSVAATQSISNVVVAVNVSDVVPFYVATMTLDGSSKPAYLERPVGYWDGDGCDMWWVSDDTKGRLRFTAPSLAPGSHTAVVNVRNVNGASSTYSWTFTVAQSGTVFTGAVPGDGTSITKWDPEIGIWADGVVDVSEGPVVTVDGVAHSVGMLWGDQKIDGATWEDIIYNALPWEVPDVDFTKGWVAWRPTSLADGHHTVSVRVGDATGRMATYAWEFDVAAPPQISGQAPKNGSLVTTQAPEISAMVKDNAALTAPRMYVDGALVESSYDPLTGKLTYVPHEPLANDVSHAVRVEATDAGGLPAAAEWAFTVQIHEDMAVSSTCEDCHDPTTHPMGNCNACHAVVPQIGHGLTPAPASRCTGCHRVYSHGPNKIIPGVTWGGADEPQEGYTGYWGLYCDWCHTPTRFPTIPAHPADNATYHDTDADVSACAPCHVRSLTREHNRYIDDTGTAYDCDTCHGAGAPDRVKAAVGSGDTSCSACHTSGASGSTHPHPAAAIEGVLANEEKECTACHATDIVAEHAKATSVGSDAVCDTCHAPGGPREDIVGAWDRSCETDACHAPGSSRAVHENWCLACHGPGQPDFAMTKTDFSAPQGIDSSKCVACHGPGVQQASVYQISPRRKGWARHLNHEAYNTCSSCHTGFPNNSDQVWKFSHFATTPEGSFASSISPTLSEGIAHEVHAAGSWCQDSVFTLNASASIVCGNCHSPAGCATCHDVTAFPASHATHVGGSGRTVAVGADAYIWPDTRTTETAACASSGCHAPATLASPAAAQTDQSAWDYQGSWSTMSAPSRAQNGSYAVSSGSVGDKVSFTVQGPGKTVIFGAGNDDGGIATVLVDGQAQGVLDCYQVMNDYSTEPGPRWGVELFETAELGPGSHTIELVATGTNAALSSGTKIYVDAAWTYPTRDLTPSCTSCHTDRLADHW